MGSQGRSSKQDLKQGPWRSPAYCFALHDSLSLLSYSIPEYLPRDDTLYHKLPPHMNCQPRKCYTGQFDGNVFSTEEIFPNSVLFPKNCILYKPIITTDLLLKTRSTQMYFPCVASIFVIVSMRYICESENELIRGHWCTCLNLLRGSCLVFAVTVHLVS